MSSPRPTPCGDAAPPSLLPLRCARCGRDFHVPWGAGGRCPACDTALDVEGGILRVGAAIAPVRSRPGSRWDLAEFDDAYRRATPYLDNEQYARQAGIPEAAERYRHARVKGWILREFGSASGALFLDVGTGAGYLIYQLREAYPHPPRRFVGADVSAEHLRILAARARRERPPLVLPMVADAEDLPFPADTFDGVTCSEVIEHIFDKGKALDEMARVLKPGGVLLLTTPRRSMTGMWKLVFSAPRHVGRAARGKSWRFPAQEGAYDEPVGPGRLRELAARAGLAIEHLSMAVCLPHESYLRWIPTPLLRAWIAFAGVAEPLGLGHAMGLHMRLRARKPLGRGH